MDSLPGAYAMMGMDSTTDMEQQDATRSAVVGRRDDLGRLANEEDDGNDNYDAQEDNNTSSSTGSIIPPLPHVIVEATLVTDEVVVATKVSEFSLEEEAHHHRAQTSLFQLLLCVPGPLDHQSLDETAILKLLQDFPFLFQRNYELIDSTNTNIGSAASNNTSRCTYSPLSLICRLRPSVKLLKAVHQANREALTQTDDLGCLPLHLACKWGVDIHGLKYLVHAYTQGAQVSDSDGNLPFHYLFLCQPSSSSNNSSRTATETITSSRSSSTSSNGNVVEFMLSCHSQAIQHVNHNGELPLHLALQPEALPLTEATVLKLLQLYPEAASTPTTNSRQLPLHVACQAYRWSTNLLQQLLDLYPQGVQETTTYPLQCLPLHLACQFRAPSSVIHTLLNAFPQGVSQPDGYQGYPLHYVAMNHSDSIIRRILRAFPDAAQLHGPAPTATASTGDLVLHSVLKRRCSESVVEEVLDAHPQAASVATTRTRRTKCCLPLDIALRKQKPYSAVVLHRLLSLHPEAASVANEMGEFPLHTACKSCCCLAEATSSTTTASSSSSVSSGHGLVEIIAQLIRLYPSALKVRGERGRLPLHILLSTSNQHQRQQHKDAAATNNHRNDRTTKKQSDDEVEKGTYANGDTAKEDYKIDNQVTILTVVREMLEGYPEALWMKDKRGKLPITLARESGVGVEMEELLSSFQL